MSDAPPWCERCEHCETVLRLTNDRYHCPNPECLGPEEEEE